MEQIPFWKASNLSSLKQKAYELLKKDIMNCTLKPGQRVVLGEIAARYRIGNTPIRDALQQLSYDGFVDSIPRYGYIIKPITVQDVNELFELRLLLEAPATKLAALRGSSEQILAIRQAADFSYQFGARDSYEKFLVQNAKFHTMITQTCGNSRLQGLLQNTLSQLQRIFFLGLELQDGAEEMQTEHIQLADAILQKNGDLAETICQQQIIRSKERIIEALSGLNKMSSPIGP